MRKAFVLLALLAFAARFSFEGRAGDAPVKEKKALDSHPSATEAGKNATLAARMAELVDFPGINDPKALLGETLESLAKRYDLKFKVREEAFTHPLPSPNPLSEDSPEPIEDILKTPIADSQPIPSQKGPLSSVLQSVLDVVNRSYPGLGATYVVRNGLMEITTRSAIRAEFYVDQYRKQMGIFEAPHLNGLGEGFAGLGGGTYIGNGIIGGAWSGTGPPLPDSPRQSVVRASLREPSYLPLVHVSCKNRPLDKVLSELAITARYPVVVNVRLREAQTDVSAEMSNVPLDTAVSVLANMAELSVFRLDRLLYVTNEASARSLLSQMRRMRITELEEWPSNEKAQSAADRKTSNP